MRHIWPSSTAALALPSPQRASGPRGPRPSRPPRCPPRSAAPSCPGRTATASASAPAAWRVGTASARRTWPHRAGGAHPWRQVRRRWQLRQFTQNTDPPTSILSENMDTNTSYKYFFQEMVDPATEVFWENKTKLFTWKMFISTGSILQQQSTS